MIYWTEREKGALSAKSLRSPALGCVTRLLTEQDTELGKKSGPRTRSSGIQQVDIKQHRGRMGCKNKTRDLTEAKAKMLFRDDKMLNG